MSARQPDRPDIPASVQHLGPEGLGRRRFLGYLLAAPTLAAAAQLGGAALGESAGPLGAGTADAVVPSNPQIADYYDLEDALTDAARPTANLVTIEMAKDGTVSYGLPRTEVGQGITTAFTMLIAEEMDLPMSKVNVYLADARPELVFNQLTGGSNSMNSLYTPVRVAAAIAKGKLIAAAQAIAGDLLSQVTSRAGLITLGSGQTFSYADLAEAAASNTTQQVSVVLKEEKNFTIVGKPTRRIDALAAVTGQKKYTLDMQVPNALPTMVARADTINGTPKSCPNVEQVRRMPGVTHVAQISTGWAVRAKTFGQCIDAVRALDVNWNAGPKAAESDDTVLKELKAQQLPFLVPQVPGATTVEADYGFAFASNSALEPGCAIADVRPGSAEVWSCQKIPIHAQYELANLVGLPQTALKLHVMTGGGSFGRRLFHDPASDAVEASKAMGVPVKVMWHRTDDVRQGRTHGMSHSKLRANVLAGQVVSFEQRHASVRTDFSHGFGEAISSVASRLPTAGLGVSEVIFETTALLPYNFGATKQVLMETHQSPADNQIGGGFKTASMRNVYSPNVTTAHELFVDKLAAKLGKDPYQFRLETAKDDRFRQVLTRLAKEGQWGRKLPAGMAQGIGIHREYKQTLGCLVEIDCRPQTVNRPIRDGVTGPRVTRVTFVNLPGGITVNPMGMEAQLQGGIMDGIALALTSSVHLVKGAYLEGSWDNYFYTRQWNVPADIRVITLPADKNDKVAGAGEAGVAPTMAAVACAFARAMGGQPSLLPVNHGTLSFTPKPFKPTIPQSPTDGLKYTF